MKHFLLTGLTAVLLIPGTVHAYVEPEDVLFPGDDTVIETSSSSRSSAQASSLDDGLHGAAPEESGLSAREERILERVGRNQNASSGTVYQQPVTEENLHSGAPLAHSGPESAIALAVLLVAMGTTLFFAKTGRIDFPKK